MDKSSFRPGGLVLLSGCLLPALAWAQLGGPETEAVYGGRVNAIVGMAVDSSVTRLFVATESANSLFSTTIHHGPGPQTVEGFTVLPDAGAEDGLGSGIRELAVDEGTQQLIFILQDQGLFRVTHEEGSLAEIADGNFSGLLADGGVLYTTSGGQLFGATLDGAGGEPELLDWAPLNLPSLPGGSRTLAIGPWGGEDRLFVFCAGGSTPLWVSPVAPADLEPFSIFGSLPTTGLTTPGDWTSFGVAPDGRLFLGGRVGMEPNHFKAVAVFDSTTETWTETNTGIGGTSGSGLCFAGDSSAYHVYFGTAWSSDRGGTGTWSPMGGGGFETHPNDGDVATDPNNPSVVYMTTDQGLGHSTDNGFTLAEINEGLEAVQVSDLEMDSAKDGAWLASKAGIRRVTGYQSAPVWSTAMFPNGDGSPYYSIAMDTTDHSGDTVFAGNSRIYRTTNGGDNWQMLLDSSQPPWSLNFFCSAVALEVDPTDNQRIAAGFTSGHPQGKGRLFISEDGGDTFDILDASPIPSDGMNVNDLLFAFEDGENVLYAGVDYRYSDSTATSNGVYRITGNGADGWSAVKELNWAVSIRDLAADPDGGIYAVGSDLSDTPVAYRRDPDTDTWEVLTQSGLPSMGAATAVTVGDDGAGGLMPYIAVNTRILTLADGATEWSADYDYPNGTRIEVLYYDELLVGTGTGLYGHPPMETTVTPPAGHTLPGTLSISGVWPNPFNPQTRVGFTLERSLHFEAGVYNLAGERVALLHDGMLSAGSHTLDWNGAAVASGLYVLRLSAGAETRHVKLMLLK